MQTPFKCVAADRRAVIRSVPEMIAVEDIVAFSERELPARESISRPFRE